MSNLSALTYPGEREYLPEFRYGHLPTPAGHVEPWATIWRDYGDAPYGRFFARDLAMVRSDGDRGVLVAVSGVQMCDGTTTRWVYVDSDRGVELTAEKARELAHALLSAADEIEQ